MNVFSLFEHAATAWKDRPAVRYGDRRQSYDELASAASAFAARLASLGLERGDRVALFMRNGFPYPAALLGAFRGGFVAVPINAKLHPREAAYIVEDAEAKAVVIDADMAAQFAAAATRPGVAMIVAGDPSADNALESALARRSDGSPPADCAPDDPVWLFYTSGTTGRPKGAVLSHRNLIAMAVNCLADICAFRLDDRLLHAAPLSHGSGMYLLPALSRGAENIIDAGGGFDPDRILRFIADERVTVLPFLAPTMIVRLLEADSDIRLPTLRAMVYGGAPMHIEHLRRALRRFGPVLTQLYGQGEAPMTISVLPAWAHETAGDEALQSAGFVRSGVEVRILDSVGDAAPRGAIGEIAVRGDVVMRGYWRNDAANAASLRNGWLLTGDIGRFDDGGRLHILDRRHDTIISGGTNIYPREVEEVLTRHPAVKEAIVFGVPDPEWGESVASAIVLREDYAGLDAETLIAFCRDHLASFKKPKRIEFVAELPKNAYGKVLRRDLRDRFDKQR
ncbi:acyl-CoA synthetase (AMP-forming)/AMP-acid ligase II [Roseiarcus fermentans]|uniref:3-methylmercaptopropionyl-CoA ligase n=1 Tax=Roseiarcus fermentans TaxID=1473586 RepID=A0A366FNA7_9HYPH|nr:AMP-binding protein [Roseiarcus fermentans]RBP16057.1 acyl-CoA synthetase (AMP-forming)/AMP-acid ligase II [Roseiarcus fermentans]